MPTFTKDWVTEYHDLWSEWLSAFRGVDGIIALELGTFEGRSAIWFSQNILTGTGSFLHTVDCSRNGYLDANIQECAPNVIFHNEYSQTFLESELAQNMQVDFIYIDADHSSPAVAIDSQLSFPLLKVGGVLIWDDYGWNTDLPEVARPAQAIDYFLEQHRGEYELLYKDYAVAIKKLA